MFPMITGTRISARLFCVALRSSLKLFFVQAKPLGALLFRRISLVKVAHYLNLRPIVDRPAAAVDSPHSFPSCPKRGGFFSIPKTVNSPFSFSGNPPIAGLCKVVLETPYVHYP